MERSPDKGGEMKIRSTSHRVAAFVVGIIALTCLASAAQAAASRPSQLSKSEYRGIMFRSEALNEKYRLGAWRGVPVGMTPAEYQTQRTRSQALNEKYRLGEWKGVPEGMTPPLYRALAIRSEALNERFGPGTVGASTAAPVHAAPSEAFAWRAFGIGVLAMLGLVLLVSGVIAGSRYTRDAARARTS
jgi:hypothetical protein